MSTPSLFQIERLDPNCVYPSRWANLDEGSFQGKAWEEFKNEIYSTGGNVQPIKVRKNRLIKNTQYEIVFGHRRHRACLELGVELLAFCEDLTEKQLFEEMDRENRQHSYLSPYQQGQLYCRALDEGMYPSIRIMVESLRRSLGEMVAYIRLAQLPEPVVNAFESSMHIQQRWSKPLTAALYKNQDVVLNVAKQIVLERKRGDKITSSDALKRMLGLSSFTYFPSRQVLLPGGISMRVTIGKKVRFEFDMLEKNSSDLIEQAIVEVLSLQTSASKSVYRGELFDLAGGEK